MNFRPFTHIDLERLHTLSRGELASEERARVAAHLRGCARCQDALRFIRRMEGESSRLSSGNPSADLYARALASRGAGERWILPAVGGSTGAGKAGRGRHVVRTAMLAAGVLIAALLLLRPAREVSAGDGRSALEMEPSHPGRGDAVRVRYKPAPGLFRGAETLVLRARLRTPADEMYDDGLPPEQTRAVATLRRQGDGAFVGRFSLPGSVVYATLAVEDSAAAHVDDNFGQLWEVITYAPDGRPAFDALQQRANDMMGRSWEGGYATARQLTDVYPDRFASWTLREFFERALLGAEEGKALADRYRHTVDSLIAAAKARTALSYSEIQTAFYRSWVTVRYEKASAADSAELDYWWMRIRREYPRHGQVAQRLAIEVGSTHRDRPRAILDSLEVVYAALAPLTGAGRNVIHTATFAARQANDSAAMRTWAQRSLVGRADSAFQAALFDATRPEHRWGAMVSLRSFLRPSAAGLVRERRLGEAASAYDRRVQNARRRALVALGRALLAEGQRAAALDTLTVAARGGWDPAVLRDIHSASLAAGDTATAVQVSARLAVDPRTDSNVSDTLSRFGRERAGSVKWDSLLVSARNEMYTSYLARAVSRPVRGTPRVVTADGRVVRIRELTARQPTVLIFWSRHCGAAIDALPEIITVGERLKREGANVILLVDEPPSAEARQYLSARNLSIPTYYDRDGEARTAFANFGTPHYYVVDGAGQIRFEQVSALPELLTQVAALRSESR